MANQASWARDGGTLSNIKLSRRLRFAAQPKMVLDQLVRADEPVIGGTGGQIVNFNKISNLRQESSPTPINELNRMPETKWSVRQGQLRIDEYGIAVPYTDKLEKLSDFDPKNITQQTLGDNMAKTINTLIYNELTSTYLNYSPLSASTYNLETDGSVSGTIGGNLNAFHVREMRDILADEYHAPAFNGKGDFRYALVVSQTGWSTLMSDSTIRSDVQFAYMGRGDAAPTMQGAAAIWENVLIMLDNANMGRFCGTGTTYKSEAFMVAGDAVTRRVAMAPTVVAKTPEDYGRDKGVAWRGIFGYQLTWGDNAADIAAGEARVIHFTGV